nr:hypothetical protein [Morchella crassipes]
MSARLMYVSCRVGLYLYTAPSAYFTCSLWGTHFIVLLNTGVFITCTPPSFSFASPLRGGRTGSKDKRRRGVQEQGRSPCLRSWLGALIFFSSISAGRREVYKICCFFV